MNGTTFGFVEKSTPNKFSRLSLKWAQNPDQTVEDEFKASNIG